MQLHHTKPMASQGLCGTEKAGDRAAGFITVLRSEDLHWSQLYYSTPEPLPGRLGAVVFPEGHGVTGMQMATSRLGCVQVLSPRSSFTSSMVQGLSRAFHIGQCSGTFVCECESEKSKVEKDISWVLQFLLWQGAFPSQRHRYCLLPDDRRFGTSHHVCRVLPIPSSAMQGHCVRPLRRSWALDSRTQINSG